MLIRDRERRRGAGRHGTPAEREANEREAPLLERLRARLVDGHPIRDEALEVEEEKSLRGFRFLTQKPVLILLNVGEGDLAAAPARVAEMASRYPHRHALIDVLSARIEMELGQLDPEEAAVFGAELGIAESSLDRVIGLSYRLLGLISFLTAGPDEVRAWPIPDGSTAVDAAAAIHTDLAKGFIRAETVLYEDLVVLGAMAEARRHGKLRSEGKTYRVRDGDGLEILFSKGPAARTPAAAAFPAWGRVGPRSWSSAPRAATSPPTTRAAGGWAVASLTTRSPARASDCGRPRSSAWAPRHSSRTSWSCWQRQAWTCSASACRSAPSSGMSIRRGAGSRPAWSRAARCPMSRCRWPGGPLAPGSSRPSRESWTMPGRTRSPRMRSWHWGGRDCSG